MKKIAYAITTSLLLSACSISSTPRAMPTADQKAQLKAIQKSLDIASSAIPTSTFDHGARALGDDEARVQMQTQLQDAIDSGDCKVTKTENTGSGMAQVSGATCPIEFNMMTKQETAGERKGSVSASASYSVTKTPAGEKYRNLNDVDSMNFTFELDVVSGADPKSFTISGSGAGTVHSQRYGTLTESAKVFATLSSDGTGSLRADDSYQLPGFLVDRSIFATAKGKKTDVIYNVNGNVVTEKEYGEYGEFLLPVDEPRK